MDYAALREGEIPEADKLLARFAAAVADRYHADLEWEMILDEALSECRLVLIEKMG